MKLYTNIYSMIKGESTVLHNVLDVCELRVTFDQKLSFSSIAIKWRYASAPYCWWKKSCTSWYGKYPIIYVVVYMPGGAGFPPSRVFSDIFRDVGLFLFVGERILGTCFFPSKNVAHEVNSAKPIKSRGGKKNKVAFFFRRLIGQDRVLEGGRPFNKRVSNHFQA